MHDADRQLIASGSPYERTVGFSRAVRVGDRVMVAGTAPIWPDGHVDPDAEAQAERCLEIMLTALAEAGASASDVVRTRSFIVSAADQHAVGVDPRWKVEMEAEAIIGSGASGSVGTPPHPIPR